MTFHDIKQAIKDFCNLTSTEADTRIGAAVNRHYRRVTSDLGLPATRFVTRSGSMTIGVGTLTFSSIEKIDRVLNTTDSTAIKLLSEVNIHTLRSTQPGTGEPTQYAVQATTATTVTILTDTVPAAVWSLQADGIASLADLTATDEPALPASYHDILTFSVIAEELAKKEKWEGADRYAAQAADLLARLRFHLADSATHATRQGGGTAVGVVGTGGGGTGNQGGSSYTQSGLITFDRGAGVAPFAVDEATAAVVTNLDADKLDGEHGSYYRARANHTGTVPSTEILLTATDRLIGRDTASGGVSEEISLTGGLEFSGSQSIRIADLGVTTAKLNDLGVTTGKLAPGAATYAKIQDVSAASRVLGRGSAGGSGDVEELTIGTALTLSGTEISNTHGANQTANTVLSGPTTGSAAAPSFRSLVAADLAPADAVRTFDVDVTSTEVVNSVSATTVYTVSVPANTVIASKGFRFRLIGDYLNDTGGTENFTIRASLAGSQIVGHSTSGPGLVQSSSRRAVLFEVTVIGLTGTTQVVDGSLRVGTAGTNVTTDTNNTLTVALATMATTSLTLTSTQTFAVTVQHTTASTNVSFRMQAAIAEVLE